MCTRWEGLVQMGTGKMLQNKFIALAVSFSLATN